VRVVTSSPLAHRSFGGAGEGKESFERLNSPRHGFIWPSEKGGLSSKSLRHPRKSLAWVWENFGGHDMKRIVLGQG
jgi:hypothetical protein